MNKRLYIMTDGSAIMNKDGNYDSAYSFIISDGIKEESNILMNHTNNYAEMYAIYKSTKYVLENKINIEAYDEIIIITDSELCMKSLSVWMKSWLKNTKNEKLFNSQGALVKNQELIKSAFINMLLINQVIPIRIIHMNSHESESKKKQMYEKMSKSIPDLDIDDFNLIFEGNNKCDLNARELLKNHLQYNN